MRRSEPSEQSEEDTVEGTRQELPFVVVVASVVGFVKAGFLGLMGIIGLAAWDDVTDPWGIGALVLAALLALGSFGLMRGIRVARVVIAALAVVGGIIALVYVFVGPASAILSSLLTAALAAGLVWLLYGTRSAKEYFA